MPRLQLKPKGLVVSGKVVHANAILTRPHQRHQALSEVLSSNPFSLARCGYLSLQDEGFQNPRYVKTEKGFSMKVGQNRAHDCAVVVGHDIFFVCAYLE